MMSSCFFLAQLVFCRRLMYDGFCLIVFQITSNLQLPFIHTKYSNEILLLFVSQSQNDLPVPWKAANEKLSLIFDHGIFSKKLSL